MPFAIFMLTFSAFGIGTSEYIIMGLLSEIAEDLKITIPQAGSLVTMYAMGVVVGGPLLAILTMKLSRKIALLSLMCMFIIGNILCALSTSYHFLMVARVLAALCHGTFFGIASVVAAGMVAENKKSQAIALVFMGVSLANILGVPVGTHIGEQFGWRATFWLVSAIGILAVLALLKFIPSKLPMPSGDIIGEFKILRHRRVFIPLILSVLTSASLFTIFTYIDPILQKVTMVDKSTVVKILFWIGAGLSIGTLTGGKLGDKSLIKSLISIMFIIVIIQIIMLYVNTKVIPMIATLFVWSITGFAVCPMLQALVVEQAKGAPNLASTFNQSSFNLGNAIGAKYGGLLIHYGIAYKNLSIYAAIIMIIAIILTLYFRHYIKHIKTND
ncbi:MFS transporter [Brachyspira sp.]|uniref:MFS transporter n=1 Tax=Brachyspira sp. TaxID=1977261 RepID=UPI003D7EAD5B